MGTATEVGKTWVGAAALGRLRDRGVRVAARKPAQSFSTDDGPTDADVLGAATGERPGDVCPPLRSYELAMAPPMAADALGRPVPTLAELLAETTWPAGTEVGWVETVGGPRSPVAADADSASLAAALRPDRVVLVADAGLGAVNAVLLSAAAVAAPTVVVLNRFDDGDLHRRNRDWLARCGLDVVTQIEALTARLLPARFPAGG